MSTKEQNNEICELALECINQAVISSEYLSYEINLSHCRFMRDSDRRSSVYYFDMNEMCFKSKIPSNAADKMTELFKEKLRNKKLELL